MSGDWIPLPVIGAGSGWAAAGGLGLYVVRKIVTGELVPKSILDAAVAVGERAFAQLDKLQETHAATTAQLGESMETARFTKAVTEAVDKTRGERS